MKYTAYFTYFPSYVRVRFLKHMCNPKLLELTPSSSHLIGYEYVNIMLVYVLKTGHAMAQLVEALRNNLEGRGFDSSWCEWNFS
jgi:hypothetical protein